MSVLDLSESLEVVYDELSEKLEHNKTPRPIRLTEKKWHELFKKLGIRELNVQLIIKEVLKSVSLEERSKLFLY